MAEFLMLNRAILRCGSVIVVIAAVTTAAFSTSNLTSRNGVMARSVFQSASLLGATSSGSSARPTEGLFEWLAGVKGGSKGVELKYDSLSGVGIFSRQDKKPETVLMSVPDGVAITERVPSEGYSVPEGIDGEVWGGRKWWSRMSVRMDRLRLGKEEGGKGEDYGAWLKSLPSSHGTTFFWSDAELDDLEYAPMKSAVLRQRDEWKREYDELVKGGLSGLDWDRFVWGCETARSRCFSSLYQPSFSPLPFLLTAFLSVTYLGLNLGTVPQVSNGAALVFCAVVLKDFVVPKFNRVQNYVICPCIDMANHRGEGSNSRVEFEYFSSCYSLVTSEEVGAGSEMTISYGERGNDQLLQYYGFVEESNPHDVFIVPPIKNWNIGQLEEAVGDGEIGRGGRLEKVERAGLLGGDEKERTQGGVVLGSARGMDLAVIQGLRCLLSNDSEWKASGESVGGFAEQVSEGNERKVRMCLKCVLEGELAKFKTTLEEDEALLESLGGGFDKSKQSSKNTNSRKRMAAKFRMEKKRILRKWIAEYSN